MEPPSLPPSSARSLEGLSSTDFADTPSSLMSPMDHLMHQGRLSLDSQGGAGSGVMSAPSSPSSRPPRGSSPSVLRRVIQAAAALGHRSGSSDKSVSAPELRGFRGGSLDVQGSSPHLPMRHSLEYTPSYRKLSCPAVTDKRNATKLLEVFDKEITSYTRDNVLREGSDAIVLLDAFVKESVAGSRWLASILAAPLEQLKKSAVMKEDRQVERVKYVPVAQTVVSTLLHKIYLEQEGSRALAKEPLRRPKEEHDVYTFCRELGRVISHMDRGIRQLSLQDDSTKSLAFSIFFFRVVISTLMTKSKEMGVPVQNMGKALSIINRFVFADGKVLGNEDGWVCANELIKNVDLQDLFDSTALLLSTIEKGVDSDADHT